jgi:DNA-binding response OmpR family regulator
LTRVVVIEDEADLRNAVAEALTDEGYDVASAANGAAGLQLVRDRVPQLAVLDLMMPELDGRDVLRQCRADPRCASMKVLVITALRASHLEGLQVDAIVPKPFDLNELVDTVQSLAPVQR